MTGYLVRMTWPAFSLQQQQQKLYLFNSKKVFPVTLQTYYGIINIDRRLIIHLLLDPEAPPHLTINAQKLIF